MEIQKIKVYNNLSLFDIIHDIDRGKLKIPRFQRKFVWERSKVINLFDSIYREFPIGSFFFWQADKKYASFFRDIAELELPKPEKMNDLNFILDGQQRITSIYATLKGKKIGGTDYSKICFDLEQERFVKRDSRHTGTHLIPVCELFGNNHLKIYDTLTSAQKVNFNKCFHVFQSYPVPIVVVQDKELTDAIKIFERINQGGKRLSIFDLVVAGTWGEDFDLRDKYNELERHINREGFGRITPEVVLHAASLIIKGYCRQQYLLKLTQEEIQEKWDEIETAIKLAIHHMSANLGVKIYEFTPYPAMIALLAYLFYKIPGRSIDGKTSDLVHAWFWRAAIGERYAVSRDTAMEDDKKKIFDPLIAGKIPVIKYPINLTIEKLKEMQISTKSAIRNAFFCTLALRKPLHFKNNSPVTLDYKTCSEYNDSQKHHIFPREFMKQKGFPNKNLMLNFCFIPAELNNEIRKKGPSEYFKIYGKNSGFDETLKSHLIPTGDFINNDDYDNFIDERAKRVMEEFSRLTGTKIEQVLGQDRNKAIDKTEKALRRLIDERLADKDGPGYWKKRVPGDVQENVKVRLESYLRKNFHLDPAKVENHDRLDCCDIMDYHKIIAVNWDVFEEKFGFKSEMEKRFVNLKEFRNAVKHGRDGSIDSVLKKEGEAAVEWLDRIIKV